MNALSSESLQGPALFILSAVISIMCGCYKNKSAPIKKKKIVKNKNIDIGSIFGVDVGGTLAKFVYFEKDMKPSTKGLLRVSKSFSQINSPDHEEALANLYAMLQDKRMNSQVIRDERLSVYSPLLGGKFHFLHFESRNMESAINWLSDSNVMENIVTVGCTGGGAHKYAELCSERLGIKVDRQDELASLIKGMCFMMATVPSECYAYRNVAEPNITPSVPVSEGASPSKSAEELDEDTWREVVVRKRFGSSDKTFRANSKDCSPAKSDCPTPAKSVKMDYSTKVELPNDTILDFPYLVVNIGSGVSILKVSSINSFERVSGSSVGGGTYWGLCRLLTGVDNYSDALAMLDHGDSTNVDMLVRDIYGGGYDAIGLSGSMVASDFGKLVMKDSDAEGGILSGISNSDICAALLKMIANNIGQVAYLNARLHQCKKVFFIGNFLRNNANSCRRLAFAIDFWSQGSMEAIFFKHEGYFGAIGTFLQSAFDEDSQVWSEIMGGISTQSKAVAN